MSLRVVVAEDSGLLRESLTRLLHARGVEVVAAVADADALEEAVRRTGPDVLLTDVRMPPGDGPAGLDAALRLRAERPGLGLLVLSAHADPAYVSRLLEVGGEGIGYLLKDRVADTAQLADALGRVAAGGTAIDPDVVSLILARPRADGPLEELSAREREILGLVAEGRSNEAIAETLFLTRKTVESHMARILLKLGLRPTKHDNNRVLAVLTWLDHAA